MPFERASMLGKAAIVTGAGRGLGKQIALALADAGADVVCAARTQEQIDATADDVRARGRRALAVAADVTQPRQVDALVAAALAQWGTIDVFVANAGGATGAALKDVSAISDEEWRDTWELNVSSTFYCARAIVPHFRERGAGAIVTVGATVGRRGDARLIAYGAAKAGVMALTQSLAVALAPDGIRVNCIAPGFVLPEPLDGAEAISAARGRGRAVPVGRVGEAWEVGPLAVYLASDASSYVTGETFVIDGGGSAAGYAPAEWDAAALGRALPGS